MKNIKPYFAILYLLALNSVGQIIDAGSDATLDYNFIKTYQMGGNPTIINSNDSTKYLWECSFTDKWGSKHVASDILNDTTIANPILKDSFILINQNIKFRLSVNYNGNIIKDSVNISVKCYGWTTLVNNGKIISKGDSTVICPCNVIGGIAPFHYLWNPSYKISDIAIKNPIVYPDTSIKYRVIVTDSIGCVWEDYFTVQVKSITHLDNIGLPTKGIVYPNPLTENSRIYIPQNSPGAKIEIFDIYGICIDVFYLNEFQISMPPLKKEGVYFVKISYLNNTSQTIKVIKEH